MSLDRFLTLYCVRPVRRFPFGLRSPRLSILMYHSISIDPEKGVHPYYKISTPPALFREHLSILKNEGYAVMDLAAAMAALRGADTASSSAVTRGSPARLAAITFDDGFRDYHLNAWPHLREFGFQATVFLPTSFVGDRRQSFQGRECLTWDEVRELRRAGTAFGSHTDTHPKLAEIPSERLVDELAQSKATIEKELGEPIDRFAHPFAFPSADRPYVRRYRKALSEAGYRIGVTTLLGRPGANADPLLLRRLPVNSGDDAKLFRAKLDGAYDWLALAQSLHKTVRTMIARRRIGSSGTSSSPVVSKR
jgi:peptidoglycan/xylan/chitin deacetylase (PgdA/CDA1 family)